VTITTNVVEFRSCRGVLDTTLWNKVCLCLATGRWLSPVSPTNKTDCHDIAEILLKVTLNTINPNLNPDLPRYPIDRYYFSRYQTYIWDLFPEFQLTFEKVLLNVSGYWASTLVICPEDRNSDFTKCCISGTTIGTAVKFLFLKSFIKSVSKMHLISYVWS
jgi:hypothetical protein